MMFNGLSLEAHRLAAMAQIENLMARHSYYHAANMNSDELEDLWSKKRADDLTWQQNFGMWKSMAHISPYYGEGHAETGEYNKQKLAEAKPELAEKLKEIDGRRLNEMPIHTLTTSIIEIAEDGLSAKGLWYTPGYAIRRNYQQDEASATWMWEKYGADFVWEDGQWKFLHIQIGMDLMGGLGTSWASPRPARGPGGPGGPGGPPPAEEKKEPEKDKDGKELKKAPSMGGGISQPPDSPGKYQVYSRTRVPEEYPKVPVPYKTLEDTFSY